MKARESKILLAILAFVSISTISWDLKPKITDQVVPCHLPPQIIDQIGDYAFKTKLKKCELSENAEEQKFVKTVGGRIRDAAARSKYGEVEKDFDRTIELIKDDETIDAFSVPSGKIAIYSGMFQVVKDNEAMLAFILGHEVTHAMARHVSDHIDQELCRQIAASSTGLNLKEGGLSTETTLGIMGAMGIAYEGAVMKPFIREQEFEADYLGLLLMADAGYNPEAALTFWNEMKKKKDGGSPLPEFTDNHPDINERIDQLKQWMPDASQEYQKSAFMKER